MKRTARTRTAALLLAVPLSLTAAACSEDDVPEVEGGNVDVEAPEVDTPDVDVPDAELPDVDADVDVEDGEGGG